MIKDQLLRNSEKVLETTPLTHKEMNTLIEVSNSVASSINGHGATAIFITDENIKSKMCDLNYGQTDISQAPLFILFLTDLNRTKYAFEKNPKEGFNLNEDTIFHELSQVGLVDAIIKAQAIVDAASELGLGTCYKGGVRATQGQIIKLFNLPDQIIPVLGLTVGHVKTPAIPKPKMNTVFINEYSDHEMKNRVDEYDEVMNAYFNKTINKDRNWSGTTAFLYNNWFNENKIYKTQKELLDKKYKK